MKKLVLIFLFLIPLLSIAQKSDVGNWFLYFGNQSFKKKWNVWNEFQYRSYNYGSDLQQLVFRLGLGYNLTENNNNVLLGYSFMKSENYIAGTDNKQNVDEHRIYQQYITKQNFSRVYIQHRYRIEERFFKNETKMRYRYFLSLNVPVTRKTMTDKTIYLSAYSEIFINSKSPYYDRLRLYGAAGYQFNKNIRLELGMLKQHLEKTSRNQFQIVLFNTIPFKK
jgi:opacity protein-like surface antigen